MKDYTNLITSRVQEESGEYTRRVGKSTVLGYVNDKLVFPIGFVCYMYIV